MDQAQETISELKDKLFGNIVRGEDDKDDKEQRSPAKHRKSH